MKKIKLNKKDKELIALAKKMQMESRIKNKQLMSEACASLIDSEGEVHTGSSMTVEGSSSGSICAEQAALSKVVEEGKKEIKEIVTVWVSKNYNKNKKWDVISPCGNCRHVLSKFGNPWVIVSRNCKVKLKDLYPFPVK